MEWDGNSEKVNWKCFNFNLSFINLYSFIILPSFNLVHNLHSLHKGPDVHIVICWAANFLSFVEDRVEFADLVVLADVLEQSTDLFARSNCLEVELGDAYLSVGLREK